MPSLASAALAHGFALESGVLAVRVVAATLAVYLISAMVLKALAPSKQPLRPSPEKARAAP